MELLSLGKIKGKLSFVVPLLNSYCKQSIDYVDQIYHSLLDTLKCQVCEQLISYKEIVF